MGTEKELNKKLLVSIIIPVYKVEKFLKKCIESVLKQTYENIEVILVDDGSPDKCGEICDDYAKLDKRIQVIHKENGGLSSARNYGLDISNGEYIAFVDGDDYIADDFIESLLVEIINTGADLVMCSLVDVDEAGVITKRYYFEPGFVDCDLFWYNLYYGSKYELGMVAWNKLYKKSLWQMLRFPVGKIHEDEYILHKVIEQCSLIRVIDEVLYYYVRHASSITKGISFKRLDCAEAYLDRTNYFIECGKTKFARTSLIRAILISIEVYNKNCINSREEKDVYKGIRMRIKKICVKIFKRPVLKKEYLYAILYFINEKIFLFFWHLGMERWTLSRK